MFHKEVLSGGVILLMQQLLIQILEVLHADRQLPTKQVVARIIANIMERLDALNGKDAVITMRRQVVPSGKDAEIIMALGGAGNGQAVTSGLQQAV